ncbi:unnamed protein product [Effrenium voratum]|nr:unnamed protein product [Effrenium voratum]
MAPGPDREQRLEKLLCSAGYGGDLKPRGSQSVSRLVAQSSRDSNDICEAKTLANDGEFPKSRTASPGRQPRQFSARPPRPERRDAEIKLVADMTDQEAAELKAYGGLFPEVPEAPPEGRRGPPESARTVQLEERVAFYDSDEELPCAPPEVEGERSNVEIDKSQTGFLSSSFAATGRSEMPMAPQETMSLETSPLSDRFLSTFGSTAGGPSMALAPEEPQAEEPLQAEREAPQVESAPAKVLASEPKPRAEGARPEKKERTEVANPWKGSASADSSEASPLAIVGTASSSRQGGTRWLGIVLRPFIGDFGMWASFRP